MFSAYNPHTSSFLQSQQQPTASILYTKAEEIAFQQNLEKQARIERIKGVREQEKHLSKVSLANYEARK